MPLWRFTDVGLSIKVPITGAQVVIEEDDGVWQAITPYAGTEQAGLIAWGSEELEFVAVSALEDVSIRSSSYSDGLLSSDVHRELDEMTFAAPKEDHPIPQTKQIVDPYIQWREDVEEYPSVFDETALPISLASQRIEPNVGLPLEPDEELWMLHLEEDVVLTLNKSIDAWASQFFVSSEEYTSPLVEDSLVITTTWLDSWQYAERRDEELVITLSVLDEQAVTTATTWSDTWSLTTQQDETLIVTAFEEANREASLYREDAWAQHVSESKEQVLTSVEEHAPLFRVEYQHALFFAHPLNVYEGVFIEALRTICASLVIEQARGQLSSDAVMASMSLEYVLGTLESDQLSGRVVLEPDRSTLKSPSC